MKYITIFHANLNYAYLTEDRYEFVIRRAYEMTLDTMQICFPQVKFVFEALHEGHRLLGEYGVGLRCPEP